jgi:hypothetical protein
LRHYLGSVLWLLIPIAAHAALLEVSESGTWGPGAPTTTWSAPNTTWQYLYFVQSNPSVSNVAAGTSFSPAFTGFSYTLGGSPVATTPTGITFFNSNLGGLMNIDFSGGVFGIEGGQAYSGSESAPTILTGTYPISGADFVSGENSQPFTGDVIIADANTAPEPSTFSLTLIAAIFGTAFWRLRRRARVDRI